MSSFKSSASASEASATDALLDLNIDEDALSDEYDFMDDVAQPNGNASTRRREKDRDPKKKYMEILQKVVDRQIDQVTIELDDLDSVSILVQHRVSLLIFFYFSTKKPWATIWAYG